MGMHLNISKSGIIKFNWYRRNNRQPDSGDI